MNDSSQETQETQETQQNPAEAVVTEEQLDHSPGEGWTFRELALHLKGSTYYADAVGRLT
jgi:hypothetical protein